MYRYDAIDKEFLADRSNEFRLRVWRPLKVQATNHSAAPRVRLVLLNPVSL